MPEEREQTSETEDGATTETEEAETQPEGTDLEAISKQLEETRKALRKANREAAERRKAIEAYELKEKERQEAEMSEIEKLNAHLSEMEARAREAEARLDLYHKEQAFYKAAAGAKFGWASEQARRDAVLLLDLDELDDDDMEGAVKALKESRPYLFADQQMPDIDGKKRGKGTKLDEEEERIQAAARRYGVRYVSKE